MYVRQWNFKSCSTVLAETESEIRLALHAELRKAFPNPTEESDWRVSLSMTSIAAGEASYKKQCMMCHGEQFKGDGPAAAMFQKAPPDLSTKEARERMTDGEMFYKITVGKGKNATTAVVKLEEDTHTELTL